MQTFLYVEQNIFAFVVLLLIFLNLQRRTDRHLLEHKLFLALLLSDALILILDSLMWVLDGKPGSITGAAYLFVIACYYCLNPAICLLWSLYADYQITNSKEHLKKIFIPLLIPLCINVILSFLSIFTKQMFYIDANHVYHRGSLFHVMAAISYFYLFYTLIQIVLKRHRIEKYKFLPLLIFSFPPLIGGLIQMKVYGISLIWVCVTVSILIVFMNAQNDQLNTDYLTGVYNRRQLDRYLQQKVQSGMGKMLLAGIMIDLDAFKHINDQYGHAAGDEALKYAATILKKSFRKNDFIARYGGDEFVVIIEIKDRYNLLKSINRLKNNVTRFNTQKIVPYTLSLSIGYDCYTSKYKFDVQKFIKHIDNLMYEDKKNQNASLRQM